MVGGKVQIGSLAGLFTISAIGSLLTEESLPEDVEPNTLVRQVEIPADVGESSDSGSSDGDGLIWAELPQTQRTTAAQSISRCGSSTCRRDRSG